jgi:hypothetical protein
MKSWDKARKSGTDNSHDFHAGIIDLPMSGALFKNVIK